MMAWNRIPLHMGDKRTAWLEDVLVWVPLLISFTYLIRMIASLSFNIDEIEHFHATSWIASGLLPYRDFWEHHTPLHWVVMSPIASHLGPLYASSLIWMRLFNQAWTLGAGALVLLWVARAGTPKTLGPLLMALLFGAPFFARYVAEYRPDVFMNLLYLVGLILAEQDLREEPKHPWRLLLAGLAFGLSCLASQRMIPLVLATTALYCLVRRGDFWGFRLRGLATVLGGAVVSVGVITYFWLNRALQVFFFDNVTMNMWFEQGPDKNPYGSFWYNLFVPSVTTVDVSYMAMTVIGLVAVVGAIGHARRAVWSTRLLVLVLAEAAFLIFHQTLVLYMFQTFWWLILLLACEVLPGLSYPRFLARPQAIAVLSLGIIGATLISYGSRPWAFWAEVQGHQAYVMRKVDAVTNPSECVWDGTGYALHRPPAFKYWFLPRGVRYLTNIGRLDPFDANSLVAKKPAAIIMDNRLMAYVRNARDHFDMYVSRHYLPLDTNIWIPAPNALLTRDNPTAAWAVLRSGAYRVVLAPTMVDSPWFKEPLSFSYLEYLDLRHRVKNPERFRVDTRALAPPAPGEGLRFSIDGHAIELPADGVLHLVAGQRLAVASPGSRPLPLLVTPVKHPVYFEVPFPYTPLDLGFEMFYPDQTQAGP